MNFFKFNGRGNFFRALHFPIPLAVFILSGAHAFALDPEKSLFQFNCENWTRQSGLPANKINTVAQSQNGYIWLGTQNGLVRFDGMEFKAIPVGLPQALGQDVRSLVATRDGSLAFAINNGGFGSFDGKKFSTVGDDRWSQQGINATTLFETDDGTLWTAAELGTGRLPEGKSPADFFAATNTGIVLSICGDNSGGVWMGTAERGLFHWSEGKFTEMPDELLRKRNIFAVAMDAEGQIWVGSGHGLVCYANGKLKATPAFAPEVRALLFDKHGVLWIGTSGFGLARYQNGQFTYLKKSDGLGGDYVTSLFEDSEGSLWVGTRDGLSQLTDLKFPIYSIKEGLPRGSCHSVFASQRGGLWLTTDTGFSYFNGQNFVNYTNDSILPNHYIKSIFEARDGKAYIVDGDKNILVMAGEIIQTRYTNSLWPSAIAEDVQGLLVGLGTGNGLYRLQAGELRHYSFGSNAPPDFYWINNLCVGRDGTIWVASNNGIFQIKNGSWKQWSTAEGLVGTKVQWIFEDTDGSIWTGSSAGLARLKDGKIRNIKKEDGLHDDRIYSIIPDDFESFWIASGGGIFRASRKSLNDFADGKSARVPCDVFDGLESVKFNDQTDQEYSGCKTLDGRIWFPNPQGVVMINPAHYFTNGIAPRVYVQEVRVNRVETKDRRNLRLEGGSRVQFFFSALSYIAPQKIQLLYQLEGFDQMWIEAGSQRAVLYNNLKPGKYTFRVRAANADGVWNRTGDSIPLEVPPLFYQKIWFVLMSAAAVLLVLFGAYRWKIRHIQMRQMKLQAANDALEAKVGKRTQELAGVNASLHHEIGMHKDTEAKLKLRTQLLENEVEERKRMQQAVVERTRELQSKTVFLEAQVNSSLDGILVVDDEGKMSLQNQRFVDLLKIPPHIVAEKTDENRLKWVTDMTKNPGQFLEKVRHLYSHRDEVSRDEIELKDGTVLDRYSSPVVGKDGKYYGRIWTFRDITRRKRNEEILRESEERFSGAFMHAPIGIALVSPDGHWLKVNQAICDLVGYSEAELLSRTFQDITHPEDLESDLENVRRMIAGEIQTYQMEKRYLHARGHLVTVLLNVSLVRDAQGSPRYFISQIQDITERKRLEAQLFQSQKMETVGKLAGGIAHEFNSILTAIIGQSELLREDLPPGSPLAQNAAEISKAAERAATLTRQLLAYGRKQFLQPESLDLNQIVAGMAGMFQHLMGGEVDIRIVPTPALQLVKADAGQIEQVIMNIVMNARDAMPHGGQLTLETANVAFNEETAGGYPELKPGNYVMLAISDTGSGMSAEVKARVFEPFFSTKDVGQGTGLGLSTCYGIVKQSGGHISVYSEPGRGTTFKIYLPQVEAAEKIPVQLLNSPALPRGSETILLVEDDPALREMAATLLRRLGYKVFTAVNGLEALALKKSREVGHIDLLFTDVVMPHMSGKELADRVHALHPHTKVLFTSAYTENAIVHQGVLDQGVTLLQKPFTPSALANKLREVLDR